MRRKVYDSEKAAKRRYMRKIRAEKRASLWTKDQYNAWRRDHRAYWMTHFFYRQQHDPLRMHGRNAAVLGWMRAQRAYG